MDVACDWCGEPIEHLQDIPKIDLEGRVEMIAMHRECTIRMMFGPVAHYEKKCSCYGGNEHDPPGMSKREAAKAAMKKWQEMMAKSPMGHILENLERSRPRRREKPN